MSAADVCAEELRGGRNPSEIAHQQGISLTTVFSYLDRAVGEDKITRSEIYFSMPQHLRARVEAACTAAGYRYPRGSTAPVSLGPLGSSLADEDADSVKVCLRYGPASRYYGDLYEVVRRYEIDLHRLVRDVLIQHFGDDERAWWFQGVPTKVRVQCAGRAEELGRWDLDPWNCTMLLDLQSVIDQLWKVFDKFYRLPSKNDVASEIKRVNDVRNRVMHPVRDSPPTEVDFDTLNTAYKALQSVRARFYGDAVALESRAV